MYEYIVPLVNARANKSLITVRTVITFAGTFYKMTHLNPELDCLEVIAESYDYRDIELLLGRYDLKLAPQEIEAGMRLRVTNTKTNAHVSGQVLQATNQGSSDDNNWLIVMNTGFGILHVNQEAKNVLLEVLK